MTQIEAEMDANDGIYPQNGGAVSKAEVARRAGAHDTTFHSPKQAEFGTEVGDWVKRLKSRKAVSRGAVRRELSTRIADWKALYEGLQQSHRDTELDLQQTKSELAEMQFELQRTQQENTQLRQDLAKLTKLKVVALKPSKR